MKVLSFLQLCYTEIQYVDYVKIGLIGDMEFANIRDFYAQPFKPELITELFEGFNLGENEIFIKTYLKIIDETEHCSKHVNIIKFGAYKYIYDISNGVEWLSFLYPRTLDDFITDCQRTGIKLTWKVKV